MAFSKENRGNTLSGIFFVMLFATSATYLAEFAIFKSLNLSPLVIGIVLGAIYANTLRNNLPKEWQKGIIFSTKTLLRFAIVLYGFRLTFQNIKDVGFSGVLIAFLIIVTTFLIGYIVGVKVLKLDKDTTILTSAGSAICGAAAVLATESVVKAEPYKSAIAVSTVVVYGTIGMFLYPFIYKLGWIDFDTKEMGVYIGATLHEVASVVAGAAPIDDVASKYAIIVKIIRVMFLAPFLIILAIWLAKSSNVSVNKNHKIPIPWFAIYFVGVVIFNSFDLVPHNIVFTINEIDTFLLTMAMTALGMETSLDKFKNVGLKPIYLATILFAWLIFGGYFMVKIIL